MSGRPGPDLPSAAPLGSAASQAPRRFTHMEHESNCHRMTRVPDRFAAKPVPPHDSPSGLTPFATSFVKENPGAADLSALDAKLERLAAALGSGAEPDERLEALAQKKAMVYLVHGDASPEMRACLRDLALFYARNERPDSALRNWRAAERVPAGAGDAPAFAVELAEALLAAENRRAKCAEAASAAIARVDEAGDLAPRVADRAGARVLGRGR